MTRGQRHELIHAQLIHAKLIHDVAYEQRSDEQRSELNQSAAHPVYLGALILGLICASLCLMSAPTYAQRSTTVKRAGAFPLSVEALYEGQRSASLKIEVEREMGLYLVEPPRRHISEITDYEDRSLHFHLWRPINETRGALWARAFGWLVFGRVQYSRGAQQLFADLPELKRVTLSFHEVIREEERDRRGGERARRRRKRRRLSPDLDIVQTYLTVSLTRSDFERLDVERLRECSRLLDCPREVRSMASIVKFNTRYLKRRSR